MRHQPLRKLPRGRRVTEEEVIEALDANEESGKAIPENVQKLLDFMDETGGDLEDYVKLNQDTCRFRVIKMLYESTTKELNLI